MVSMTGRFHITYRENCIAYLRSIGVDPATCEPLKYITPVTEITNKGDKWKIRITYAFKTTEIHFRLGEEFDDTTLDDRPCRSLLYTEGADKLIHVIRFPNGVTSRIVREFTEGGMNMFSEGPGNTVSICIYRKQQGSQFNHAV